MIVEEVELRSAVYIVFRNKQTGIPTQIGEKTHSQSYSCDAVQTAVRCELKVSELAGVT